ncbi:hypothetical protein [Psychrobacter sp. Sarcosine-3u-12]|uniref:hypothetical protein n=1 Tax=Psychrobacter sp. Sarcosine-3u-12 TaxID=2058325 RepID=UPI000C33F77D|nr:hypothetical protein [Psychrobacter sp. Sarcosine-3u-12]PKG36541.1 hypothetical protein CXF65_01665 [Psychrobacter sp. Sarcosine-3u-12]
MAQYIFVKTRHKANAQRMLTKLNSVVSLLTPESIKNNSRNNVKEWSKEFNSYYAIQNSDGISEPTNEALVIGWIKDQKDSISESISIKADGSYAVINKSGNDVSFFSDQFGSRTLWYYHDENSLIVSTSQRAIVALKGSFILNEEAVSWYLSSGCQGPFISWDQEIKQVLPKLEYRLNAKWGLELIEKPNMQLPVSGNTKLSDYLSLYQKQVTQSLKQVVNDYREGQVLLPISGGLDSRLLLALSKEANIDDSLKLINWGVLKPKDIFDDKKAAHSVAEFYNKSLLDISLPTEINDYDQILGSFVALSEGRIDHFNAFTDSFKMWNSIFQQGYRMIIRGDIPYTEGLDLDENQARSHIGLNSFKDYINIKDFDLERFIRLQRNFEISRLDDESLLRWRDRLYVNWRVPMVISAFSNQISAFTENQAPMFNWSLYKLYVGLPDKSKGDKYHIYRLWKKYDKSKISTKATSSLASLNSYFESDKGIKYLLDSLYDIKKSEKSYSSLASSVLNRLSMHSRESRFLMRKRIAVIEKSKNLLSSYLPALPKAYLKSKRPKNLSVTTLAYRIVLIDKIISMYEYDAEFIKVND